MKLDEIPQDESKIFQGQKKVIYATQNGRYQTATSTGWQAEEFATQQAVDELAQQAEHARQAVKRGEKSVIYYLMYKNRYDLPTLAQTTGFWQWQIKRHFKPKVFEALSLEKRKRYQTAFNITELNTALADNEFAESE